MGVKTKMLAQRITTRKLEHLPQRKNEGNLVIRRKGERNQTERNKRGQEQRKRRLNCQRKEGSSCPAPTLWTQQQLMKKKTRKMLWVKCSLPPGRKENWKVGFVSALYCPVSLEDTELHLVRFRCRQQLPFSSEESEKKGRGVSRFVFICCCGYIYLVFQWSRQAK